MEKTTQERLVGAVILVGLVVLIVPALLTGPREPLEEASGTAAATRSVEIDLRPAPAEPPAIAAPADAPEEPATQPRDGSPVPRTEPDAAPEPPKSAVEQAPAAPRPAVEPAAAPAVATEAASPPGAWAAQVAALSRQDAAERLVAELRKRGYQAFLLEYRSDGRVLYRVRVGPEQDRARIDSLAGRLRQDGYQAAVVAHP